MRVGWLKITTFAYFSRYIVWTFTSKTTFIVLCSPLVALQWYRNRCPWMTLNCHFALKSVSGSATNGLATWRYRLSDKIVRKFAELPLPVCCQRQKCSLGERSFWQYKVYADIRGSSLGRVRQIRVGSLKMAIFAMSIFASFVHCLPNILHTWSHDSFHMMRLSMTLAIFQDH